MYLLFTYWGSFQRRCQSNNNQANDFTICSDLFGSVLHFHGPLALWHRRHPMQHVCWMSVFHQPEFESDQGTVTLSINKSVLFEKTALFLALAFALPIEFLPVPQAPNLGVASHAPRCKEERSWTFRGYHDRRIAEEMKEKCCGLMTNKNDAFRWGMWTNQPQLFQLICWFPSHLILSLRVSQGAFGM